MIRRMLKERMTIMMMKRRKMIAEDDERLS